MMCGAKCFIVEMQKNDETKEKMVTARTPAAARKTIRSKYGKETKISSVREQKRNMSS